jgi:hypothetical protein
MAEALSVHADTRSGPHRQLVGPFVCPFARLGELDACVAGGVPAPTELSLVAYQGEVVAKRAVLRSEVIQVEAPLGVDLPNETLRVRRYLEIPSYGEVRTAVDQVARQRARLKVRCGGLTPDAVPAPKRLAETLAACAARRLPLKATAGLHHPFRHQEPSRGGPQHGFLNLLAAASAAAAGAEVGELAEILETEEDGAEAVVSRIDRHARDLVTSIGSCSIEEPVADLQAVGLL